MSFLTLEQAETICNAAMEMGKEEGFNPITVAVYDAGGALRVVKHPDPATVARSHMALAKAWGAYATGSPTRALAERHKRMPELVNNMNLIFGGQVLPVPGGVLIRDASDNILGAVGCAGDRPHRDEACAIAGVKAAGLILEPETPVDPESEA